MDGEHSSMWKNRRKAEMAYRKHGVVKNCLVAGCKDSKYWVAHAALSQPLHPGGDGSRAAVAVAKPCPLMRLQLGATASLTSKRPILFSNVSLLPLLKKTPTV